MRNLEDIQMSHHGKLVDAMRYVRWRSSAPSLLIMRLYDYYDRSKILKEKEFVSGTALLGELSMQTRRNRAT